MNFTVEKMIVKSQNMRHLIRVNRWGNIYKNKVLDGNHYQRTFIPNI